MKLIEYIKEKFVFMVINIVMTLSGVVILKALKVDTYTIVFISILNLIGVFSCYIYDYFNRKKYYDNLKIFLDYIQNNFNIEINNKWKVQINKISNDYGLVRFVYYINGYISTNKAITFSVNDKKVEKVYYSFINENLDESVIINKVKKFKNNIVQEKKKLNKDETLIEEKTTYDYNYRTNKITYTYCLYFQNGYGIINNDYCSIYFLH